MIEDIFDVIIVGGGPAGVAAGVYIARKNMRTLLITESFGGQSIISGDIQNWIGEIHISGIELAKKLEAHVRAYPDIVNIKTPEKVIAVKSIKCDDAKRLCDFEIKTDKGSYTGKSVIIATGARRKRLGIPGEDKFQSKGVVYCSICDAPFFKDKKVAVVGGGNSGLEAVQDLIPYAQEITILEYGESIRGDQSTLEDIKRSPKLKEIILNVQTLEIFGEAFVTGIKYQDKISREEKTLEVGGIFVEIGMIPNSETVKDLVQLDPHGEVMVNFQYATTSHPGVFAAGDVTNDPYKQNNISVGDGVRAALSAHNYLLNIKKQSPSADKSYA